MTEKIKYSTVERICAEVMPERVPYKFIKYGIVFTPDGQRHRMKGYDLQNYIENGEHKTHDYVSVGILLDYDVIQKEMERQYNRIIEGFLVEDTEI